MKTGDKYSKLAASFLTTHHKEFNNAQIKLENMNSDSKVTGGENLTPNIESRVFLAGVMSLENYDYKLSYDNLYDLFTNIASMTKKEHNAKVLVYMHGLNYHGSYLLSFLLKNKFKQTLKTNFFGTTSIGYKEFAMLSCNNKIFHIIFYWNGIMIKFVDSLKIIPQELKDLGKEIKLEQIESDYTKYDFNPKREYPKEGLDALKRKCEITAKYMNMYFKYEKKATNLHNETIGTIAYDYVRKEVNSRIPNFKITDYIRWQPGYIGAISFPNLEQWGKWVYKPKMIHSIDKNSAYGFAMCQKLPFGHSRATPAKSWKNYCCFYKILVKRAKIKQKYETTAFMWRPFEYDKEGNKKYFLQKNIDINYNYVQKATNKIYYVTDIELEQGKELYDIKYKVLEKHYFQTENYLEPIIRKIYKFSDKKAKRTIVNIYGKFGQKGNKEQDFYGTKEDIDLKEGIIKSKKDSFYEGYNIIKIKQTGDKAKPIFLASYITSYVRVVLMKKIREIIDKGGTFLNDDTDMVTFIDNPTNPIVFTDMGENIEQGKYEFQNADAYCCLCPKQYRVVKDNKVIKFAAAGINRDAMAAVKNQDYNYDLGDNDKYQIIKNHIKNTENGKIIINESYNFKKGKQLKRNPICPKELWN